MNKRTIAALLACLLLLAGCSDTPTVEGPLLIFPDGEGFSYTMEVEDNPNTLIYGQPHWTIEKDGLAIGYAARCVFGVPFSQALLEDPIPCGIGSFTSMFMGVRDRWEYPLDDGWICYLFYEYHSPHGENHDAGFGYEALIGRPGESEGFILGWEQFLISEETHLKIALSPVDPGFVSFEEIEATIKALKIE